MMANELQNMVLPHNLSEREYLRSFKKLINTAQELGGIIYDVAEDSGLLSAERFMRLQFDGEEPEDCPAPEHMTIVTEVYVEFGEGQPLDRIFLYSENSGRDKMLLQEGRIRDRKLVIPYEKLAALHEKGYKCIYGNAPDGRNGKAFARYSHSFGEDRRLARYEMWNWFPYVGNGFNQGLMLQTPFDTILVMPDLHAVRESIKTYHAENLVRETVDATFSVERIPMRDERVLAAIAEGSLNILGSNDKALYEELRDGYKGLIYRIAYIQMYYPKIYETVWAADFEADDEKSQVDLFYNPKHVSLGICLDGKESYAMCKMPDGSLKCVPNMNNSLATPLCQKYGFKGYGTIRNAGTAGSRMGLILKDIIQSAEFAFEAFVEKVNITHPGELPGYEEIDWWMQRRKKRALKKLGSEATGDLIAYEQIADRKLNGEGIVRWAAELAGLTDFTLVDSFEAIMKAFEASYPGVFQVEKPVLLYFFTEETAYVSLLKKHADGTFEIVERVTNVQPEGAFNINEWDEEEYLPDLLEVLENDMEDYLLESGLGALGISAHSSHSGDRKAFAELRNRSKQIKQQFRRNDRVRISFDNGYLSLEEDYPIERLEKCFAPILEKNARCLKMVLERAELSTEDISELIMIGEETEYPFVRKHMEQLVGKQAKCLNGSKYVDARGTALF